MNNEKKLFKYDKDITWSLPVLCLYEPIWGAIHKCLKEIDVSIPKINAYGSPPNNWTGGRIPAWVGDIDKNAIKTTFAYLQSVNATPSLTFSYRGITKEDLEDKQANYLLDMALEAKAHFIVYSDLLKNYIKEKDPDAYVVASVIKAQNEFQNPQTMKDYTEEKETNLYNKLLKEYDLVVVRPEYAKLVLSKNPEIIDDISRIEVLINQPCIMNCPRMPAHYTEIESFRNRQTVNINPNFQCIKQDLSLKEVYKNLNSIEERTVQKLVDFGVRHLKLQGRGDNNSNHAQTLMIFGQMFNMGGSPYILIEELMHYAIDEEVNNFINILNKATDENTEIRSY